MTRVKIFTDSTSDLSQALIKENDISIVPLYVSFGSEYYKDGVDINTEVLYKKVNDNGKLPKTSAPSPKDFHDAFKPYIDDGCDIIYIGLSSGLSSTIQNAVLASNDFPKGRIEIVDSLNLSTGIGLLVMRAADFIKEGLDVHETASKIRELVPKVKTAFVIDTLDYLYKGGRCSALENIIGSVLRIKPVIQVADGKMTVARKLRGKRDKVINSLLEFAIKNKDTISPERIMVTHSMNFEDAPYLQNQLKQNIDVQEVIITDAGCVISSHCGPMTIGILYIAK